MLPKYTFALGGTESIKKVFDFLNSQQGVAQRIKEKYENKEAFTG